MESYCNDKGLSTSRVVYSLGKIEDYAPEQLMKIGIKIFELGGGEVKCLLQDNLEERSSVPLWRKFSGCKIPRRTWS